MANKPIVLLTGATGFIGRQAVACLIGRDVELHALSRSKTTIIGATSWAIDLFDPIKVSEVVRTVRPTHLLHLAWEATPGRFWNAPENLNWVAATIQLVRTFVESNGQHVIVAGTCAEYDWTLGNGIFKEDAPINPGTLYGVCKDATRRVIQEFCSETAVRWVWGRVFNPYGPGEPAQKLIASVVQAVKAGQPARCSAGSQERDYLHVHDVADVLASLTLSAVEGVVNIGSGTGTTVAEVARSIGQLAGRPDLIRLGELEMRPNDAPKVVADVRRLTNKIGWKPRYDLQSGLLDTFKHDD